MNYLFLRGLARQHGHWYGFEKKFNNNNQVLCLDIPGNGDFCHLPSRSTIEGNLDFVRSHWIKNKVDNGQAWTLIAISMGGMIGLQWEFNFPSDFEKVFIINTSAKNLVPPWKRFSFKTFLNLPRLLFGTPEYIEKSILDLTLNLVKADRNLLKMAVQLADSAPTTKKNFLIQLMAANSFLLPKFTNTQSIKKIIVISSLKDRLVSPMSSDIIAQKLNCKQIVHPLAGHDLPLDDGDWLQQCIIEN